MNINPEFGPLENLEESRERNPLEQTAGGKHKPHVRFLADWVEHNQLN